MQNLFQIFLCTSIFTSIFFISLNQIYLFEKETGRGEGVKFIKIWEHILKKVMHKIKHKTKANFFSLPDLSFLLLTLEF